MWTDISVIIVTVTWDGRMTIVRQVRRGIRGKGREWESGVRWDRWESGTCVDEHLSYHCVCDVRWTGDDCETGKEGDKGKG